jgi:hypothetical protein
LTPDFDPNFDPDFDTLPPAPPPPPPPPPFVPSARRSVGDIGSGPVTIDREAIYAALWDRISGAANFATKSRRLRHWADVSPPEQPALFMSQKGQVGAKHANAVDAPTVWTLEADFYIYVHSADPYTAPAILLNPLIDAVETALLPDPWSGRQQLGLPEMIQHAYLNGRIETAEGTLGDQELAIIPVEILCV